MSHFSVAVIGDNVAEQLAPYHEFECTGEDDQYVVNVDEMAEYKEEYTTRSDQKVVTSDGAYKSLYDDEFYREFTPEELAMVGGIGPLGTGANGVLSWTSRDWEDGRGYRAKVHRVPETAVKREVPMKELYPTFAQFLSEYHEMARVEYDQAPDTDDRCKYRYFKVNQDGDVIAVVRRTNPNNRWDWWTVGGRYSGRLRLTPDAFAALSDETRWVMEREKMRDRINQTPPYSKGFRVNFARKSDVDWDAMRNEAGENAKTMWIRLREIWDRAGAEHPKSWTHFYGLTQRAEDADAAKVLTINDARAQYHAQPAIVALKAWENLSQANAEYFPWEMSGLIEKSLDQYESDARDFACTTFAVVHEGKWYQRGEMGWWGAVSNEMDQGEWNAKYHSLIDALHDDTMITIVDCHT